MPYPNPNKDTTLDKLQQTTPFPPTPHIPTTSHVCIRARQLNCVSLYPSFRRGEVHTLLYISILMIATAYDVEETPGPRTPQYPCQICEKAVTWKQRGIACDDCQQWYNVQCMCMDTHMYDTLSNHSNLSWHCDNCGMPDFATNLFESFILDSQNSFSILNSSAATSTSSPGPLMSASSPINSRKKKQPPHSRVFER